MSITIYSTIAYIVVTQNYIKTRGRGDVLRLYQASGRWQHHSMYDLRALVGFIFYAEGGTVLPPGTVMPHVTLPRRRNDQSRRRSRSQPPRNQHAEHTCTCMTPHTRKTGNGRRTPRTPANDSSRHNPHTANTTQHSLHRSMICSRKARN